MSVPRTAIERIEALERRSAFMELWMVALFVCSISAFLLALFP